MAGPSSCAAGPLSVSIPGRTMEPQNPKEKSSAQGLDKELLSLLVCPSCHGSLDQREDMLVCRKCALGYPVRNGIPVMLLSEAVHLEGGADSAGRTPKEPGEKTNEP